MYIGAAIGAIGSLVTKGVSIYENNQKAKIDEKRRSDELQMARINADKDTQLASFTHDTNIGEGSQWVINTLKLFRPALTILPIAATASFFIVANELDRSLIIASTLELNSMAVSWWFGARSLRG
jgi:hypothetical protein